MQSEDSIGSPCGSVTHGSSVSDYTVPIACCFMLAVCGVGFMISERNVHEGNVHLGEFLRSNSALERDPLPMAAAVASSLDHMATGGVIIPHAASSLRDFMATEGMAAACLEYPDGSLKPDMVKVYNGRIVHAERGYEQYVDTVLSSGICERVKG